ncbi:MAG: plasmid partitioning protein RepB [Paracoccaceae bacterium]
MLRSRKTLQSLGVGHRYCGIFAKQRNCTGPPPHLSDLHSTVAPHRTHPKPRLNHAHPHPAPQEATKTTITPIDPHLIHATGAQDRLESDPLEDARLAAAIRDHGQQVPILVRPDPARHGHYQIVYGRRRTLACRDLGIDVHAIIATMDDSALLMAQGQENTARRNLSFAEKAHFARQLIDAGHDRSFISAALNTDIGDLSRMFTLTARLPAGLLHVIGAAPGVGRGRWQQFASLLPHAAFTTDDLIALATLSNAPSSDARFQYLVDTLIGSNTKARKAARHVEKVSIITEDGQLIGKVHYLTRRTRIDLAQRAVSIDFDRYKSDGFDDWLCNLIPALHAKWRDGLLSELQG